MCAQGLFNFKPSVRPVPLEAHIQGYPGKFYCPRMASMNKPTYAAIQVRRGGCHTFIGPTHPTAGTMEMDDSMVYNVPQSPLLCHVV